MIIWLIGCVIAFIGLYFSCMFEDIMMNRPFNNKKATIFASCLCLGSFITIASIIATFTILGLLITLSKIIK